MLLFNWIGLTEAIALSLSKTLRSAEKLHGKELSQGCGRHEIQVFVQDMSETGTEFEPGINEAETHSGAVSQRDVGGVCTKVVG